MLQTKTNLRLKPQSGGLKSIQKQIWSRNSTIMPEDIGKRFKIYNGKDWILRKVVENMVHHKWGEFALTKKKTVHKSNKRKQIKKNQ